MELTKAIEAWANPKRAEISKRFFKTGAGEYGEGDIFIGLTVPQCRIIAKKFSTITLQEIKVHLESKIHEERLISLLILVDQYKKTQNQEIIDFYVANTRHINNWDLVDTTADKILGNYVTDKNKSILYTLAKSSNIWERRIAIVATYHFIKNNKFEDTLKIAKILLLDKHDLIRKAVGWMLREVGKRNNTLLKDFLKENYKIMPRTMLRYAIEKFPELKRQQYLQGVL